MNPMRVLGLLVCIVLGPASIASATMLGPDIIRECPGCKKPVSQMTLLSGNTCGARYWTDGKMDAPMLPERPWLVKCPECTVLFWVDEAVELGQASYEWRWMHGESMAGCQWTNVPSLNIPSEKDLLAFASSNQLPEEKEFYTRQQAWHLMNDGWRTNDVPVAVIGKEQRESMLALVALLDEKDEGLRIMKAELYRELKQFEKTTELLQHSFSYEHYQSVADFISGLIRENDAVVREIPQEIMTLSVSMSEEELEQLMLESLNDGPLDELLLYPGETLKDIADQFGCSVEDIMLRNNISDPELVKPGTKLLAPLPK